MLFFYVLVAMLGVCLMATKGDLSQLSMTPLALITGLLSAMGVMFNVILPQPFAKRYGFVPTVGWGDDFGRFYLAMFSRRSISFPLLLIFGVF